MNSPDIAQFLGLLVAAWSLGFSGGYLLTKYVQAMNSVS